MTDRTRFDGVLIIGAGLAGLSAALAAAPRRALLVSPAPLAQACSSAWAQGGMAAALVPTTAPSCTRADTVAAGAGLVDPEAATTPDREPRPTRSAAWRRWARPSTATPRAASCRAWRPPTAAPASPASAATGPGGRS